jgi:hypothetical protein
MQCALFTARPLQQWAVARWWRSPAESAESAPVRLCRVTNPALCGCHMTDPALGHPGLAPVPLLSHLHVSPHESITCEVHGIYLKFGSFNGIDPIVPLKKGWFSG